MDRHDHRSLGSRLDLWHVQEDAPGMVFWHGRGTILCRALEDYVRRKMRRLGYQEVRTPQLMPLDLWIRSGHWDKFGDAMFRVDADGCAMALKPMSCPCHVQIFNQGLRSWRDLPLRYAEFGNCHRDEPSGALHGVLRTRNFVQDDAHVLCREEHVATEVARFVGLLREVYAELGFPEYRVALSTRPAIRSGDRRALGLGGSPARRGCHRERPAVRRPAGRGRLLRTEARVPPCRPTGSRVAVRHDPARTACCRGGSARATSRRTAAARCR